MPKPKVNVALLGGGFMGRAHSNGYRQVKSFFDAPVEPVLKVICDPELEAAERIAERFGWEETARDWRAVVARPDIQVVDICTPVFSHAEIAIAAARAGKAVICEKPLGATLAETLSMADAVESAGVTNMCNFNLRTIPAVTLARQLIEEGELGQINQWRSAFFQAWLVDPEFPLTWRLQKEKAGSGALGDLGSHSVDLAGYLVGDIQAVNGMMHTFTRMRQIPLKDIGRNSTPTGKMGEVTVDDAAWSLLKFNSGAFGSLEVTRMATGQWCSNRFEIYGSQGSLMFDFHRMSELQFFSLKDARRVQGYRTLNVTAPVHPYMKAWWPVGHPIGYEHTHVHALSNFFEAYAQGKSPSPSFREAARTQAVLDAVERSAATGSWIEVQKPPEKA
jgi:predicted dehydrogenase